MSEELLLQRDNHKIYATLYGHYSWGVLLCPPHPNYGGSRADSRLIAIASELAISGISALCFDYSAYTGGIEEVKDAVHGLEHLQKTTTLIGLVGYSYGALVASNAAAQFQNLKGLALISPLKQIGSLKFDPNSNCHKLIVYGLHDDLVTGDIDELYNSAKGEKQRLSLDTDHFYDGYKKVLARSVREFFQKVFQSSD